jgi:hypothetical protein
VSCGFILGRVTGGEVLFAGFWAVMCMTDVDVELMLPLSEVCVVDSILEVVCALELVREADAGDVELRVGMDVDTVAPHGGKGHQLKGDAVTETGKGLAGACRGDILILRCGAFETSVSRES